MGRAAAAAARTLSLAWVEMVDRTIARSGRLMLKIFEVKDKNCVWWYQVYKYCDESLGILSPLAASPYAQCGWE